jgi:hypothetical protein
MLAGLFATVLALSWAHHHHQLAQLVGTAAGGAAFIGGAPSFGGPPHTFLFDTWRPDSGVAVVAGTALNVTATTTTVQDLSIAGSCEIAGVACATAFSGEGISDPITAQHWVPTNGLASVGGALVINVTGTAGEAARFTPSGPALVFGDSFTRANGSLSTAPIPIGGGTWTTASGGATRTDAALFSVDSNAAVSSPPTASGVISVLIGNSAAANGCLSVTYDAYKLGSYSGPIFRSNAGGTQFWNLQIGIGHWYLVHYDTAYPWTATTVRDVVEPMAAGDVASVCFTAGNVITSYHNGVQVSTVTDATYAANTRSGLLNSFDDAGENRFVDLFQTTTTTPGLTLAIANGGIFRVPNLVSTSTVQGTQLISTVPTGTAPATVASTTKVANLNCDFLDGFTSADFFVAGNAFAGVATLDVGGGATPAILSGSLCTCVDASAVQPVRCHATGAILTIAGTAGDDVTYTCIHP